MKQAFFISIALLSNAVRSQPIDFSVNWGTEFEAPRKETLRDIVGYDASGTYAVKIKTGALIATSYTIEHYDNDLKPDKSYELEFKQEGRRGYVQYLLQIKNKLYIFYSIGEPDKRKITLYARQVNKETLIPEAAMIKVTEAFVAFREFDVGKFMFRVSRDSSKVAVLHDLPGTYNSTKSFAMAVLDQDLKTVWQKQVPLGYVDQLYSTESFKVDNNGNTYLLGVVYKEKRKAKRQGKPNYSYEVLHWSEAGNRVATYPIALEGRFITDMQIEPLDDKTLICAGFYSDKGTLSVDGTYFLKIDLATKEVKTRNFKEFGLDFIIQNMSEREANKAIRKDERGDDAELYNYDLDKLLVGKDGSCILIAEQYFVSVQTMYSGVGATRTATYIYHYYYNDIIAVKVSSDGQILWAEKVSKTQHTVNDDGFFSSYTMAILNGKICFFFNDNPINVNYKGVGRPEPYRAKECVVMLASLDQEGNQTRQPVFSAGDIEVITRPKVCEQISNTEVILFGQRRKTQQFARLTLN